MIRTFNPVAGVASAQGLDVSNYQGRFDWAGTSGLSFGIHRATQGLGGDGTNSPDPDMVWNHQQIRDAGLHRGAYHFLDPRLDGAAQARYFVDTLGHIGLVNADMLWLDNESANGCAPGIVAGCAQAFMNELHILRPRNPVGVYTFISFATTGYCDGLGSWPLWLAYPNLNAPAPPPPWSRWDFWQWGTRDGTDADAWNGTADELSAWIASFSPTGPTWQAWHSDGKTSLAQLAEETGLWVSHILGATAIKYGAYDAVTSGYVSAVFEGQLSPGNPIPVGATLWVRK